MAYTYIPNKDLLAPHSWCFLDFSKPIFIISWISHLVTFFLFWMGCHRRQLDQMKTLLWIHSWSFIHSNRYTLVDLQLSISSTLKVHHFLEIVVIKSSDLVSIVFKLPNIFVFSPSLEIFGLHKTEPRIHSVSDTKYLDCILHRTKNLSTYLVNCCSILQV